MLTSRLLLCCLFAFTLPAFAATDDEPPERFEGIEFRNIGPWRGGRVTAVAGVPSQPQTFYMGGTGGGVWKTINGGGDWKNISDGFFETGSVGAVAVSVSDPNVVVVGMGESPFRGVASSHGDGVYVSTDGGHSWVHRGLELTRQISSVQIHPSNPDRIWVAAQGSPWQPTPDRGVYRSDDGGKSWQRVLFVDDNTGAVDLKLDASNPRVMYASMWDYQRTPWEIRSGGPGSGIWKSTDGGDTWEQLTEGLPEEMGKIGVAPSAAKPGRVWAIVEAKEKGGLYRSDDGGESWEHVNGERRIQARSWYYMHILADARDANTVYVLNSAFLKSIDGGKTFSVIRGPHGDHHDLWIHPEHTDWMVNGNDGGATVTYDGGQTWSSIHNQPTAQFYRVNTDNAFAYRVYGGQQDNSTVAVLSRGPDGAVGREDYHAVGGCESAHVAFDRDDPRYIYAGCYLGQITVYDSENGAQRDIRVYPELNFGVPPRERRYRFNWNAPIVVSQHDPTVIYHAGNVVVKSTDRGNAWTEISPDLTRDEDDKQGAMGRPITNEISENYNTIMALTESPHDPQVLWAGSDDGLIHVTRDGGQNWENVTPRDVGQALVNAIEVSPHEPGVAYAAITRYKFNDHTPLIYRTDNYGGRWRQIAQGIPEDVFVRVVREDPARQGLLYAGTEVGLFVSFDDGGAWERVKLGLPVVPVTDLQVHRNDLVVATQGRAFWILDDLSPIRQWQPEQTDSVVLLEPATAHITYTSGGSNRGRGDNPPGGAVLHYWLAEAPDLAEQTVKLEVLAGDGSVLRTLESDEEKGEDGGGDGSAYALPARAGLNRAQWDFRRDPITKIDKVFAIAGGDDGEIDGYQVPPGEYRVRLSLGDQQVEQPLQVALDPRLDLTDEQIRERDAMRASLYTMLDELHRTVVSLRRAKSQIESRLELVDDDAEADDLKTAGKAAAEAIDAWEATVITTESEFFQDVLNWPSRLDSHLQELLAFTLDDPPQTVTTGIQQRYDDLRGDWEQRMAARQQAVDAIAEFNRVFAEREEPGVIVGPFRGN